MEKRDDAIFFLGTSLVVSAGKGLQVFILPKLIYDVNAGFDWAEVISTVLLFLEGNIIQLCKDKLQIMRYVLSNDCKIEVTGCNWRQFNSITLWVTDNWFMWIGFAYDIVLWKVAGNEIRRHSISFRKYGHHWFSFVIIRSDVAAKM